MRAGTWMWKRQLCEGLRGAETGKINSRCKGQHAQGMRKPQATAVMSEVREVGESQSYKAVMA